MDDQIVPSRWIYPDGSSAAQRQVRLVEKVRLLPHSEMIAEGQVEMSPRTATMLMEPLPLKEGVHAASVLVGAKGMISVRLLNATSEVKSLEKGEIVGEISEVETLETGDESNDVSQETPKEEDWSHIQVLLDNLNPELSDEQKRLASELFQRYSDVFAKNDLDLGEFAGVKHRIETGSATPIKQAARRTPLGFQDEEENRLKMLLVRKKYGGVRWCVDYRRLNEVTVGDSYPLPKIDECLDTLSGATWFSTLDLQSGYHQIKVDERDQHKTAFISRHGASRSPSSDVDNYRSLSGDSDMSPSRDVDNYRSPSEGVDNIRSLSGGSDNYTSQAGGGVFYRSLDGSGENCKSPPQDSENYWRSPGIGDNHMSLSGSGNNYADKSQEHRGVNYDKSRRSMTPPLDVKREPLDVFQHGHARNLQLSLMWCLGVSEDKQAGSRSRSKDLHKKCDRAVQHIAVQSPLAA